MSLLLILVLAVMPMLLLMLTHPRTSAREPYFVAHFQ
jgi:hypothetical protein